VNSQAKSDEFLTGLPASVQQNAGGHSAEQLNPHMQATRTFTSHIPEERTDDF